MDQAKKLCITLAMLSEVYVVLRISGLDALEDWGRTRAAVESVFRSIHARRRGPSEIFCTHVCHHRYALNGFAWFNLYTERQDN